MKLFIRSRDFKTNPGSRCFAAFRQILRCLWFCGLCIAAQIALRVTAGLALLEAFVSHLEADLEDLEKI